MPIYSLPLAVHIGVSSSMAEQKKQKVSEITGGFEDAESLVTDFLLAYE